MLHDVPHDKIITRIYNVGQIWPPPTANHLVDVVKKFYPDAQTRFRTDPPIVNILKTIPKFIKREKAEKEWGWRFSYPLGVW
jgi:hypothetical protein